MKTQEAASRTMKAIALSEFLQETRDDIATALFDANNADTFVWSLWADTIGVERPSTLCQGEVIRLLEAAASPLPSNLFKGLPR